MSAHEPIDAPKPKTLVRREALNVEAMPVRNREERLNAVAWISSFPGLEASSAVGAFSGPHLYYKAVGETDWEEDWWLERSSWLVRYPDDRFDVRTEDKLFAEFGPQDEEEHGVLECLAGALEQSCPDSRALAEAVLQIAYRGLSSTLDFRLLAPLVADRERAAYDAAGGFSEGRRAVEQLRIDEVAELLSEALGRARD